MVARLGQHATTGSPANAIAIERRRQLVEDAVDHVSATCIALT